MPLKREKTANDMPKGERKEDYEKRGIYENTESAFVAQYVSSIQVPRAASLPLPLLPHLNRP